MNVSDEIRDEEEEREIDEWMNAPMGKPLQFSLTKSEYGLLYESIEDSICNNEHAYNIRLLVSVLDKLDTFEEDIIEAEEGERE